MKTIKQIADEIGVSKQAVQKRISREPLYTRLYPCIQTERGVKYIDKTGENLIKSAFDKTTSTTSSIDVADNVHIDKNDTVYTLIAMLQRDNEVLHKELEIKNKQIEALNTALLVEQQSAQAAQALHAGTIQQQLADGGVELDMPPMGTQQNKKSFFNRIFRK